MVAGGRRGIIGLGLEVLGASDAIGAKRTTRDR